MAASLQPSDRHCYIKDEAVAFEKGERKQLEGDVLSFYVKIIYPESPCTTSTAELVAPHKLF